MQLISRSLSNTITNKLKNYNKGILLFGPRQIGKTTLIKSILPKISNNYLEINGDEIKYNDILSSRDSDQIKSLIYGYDTIFIDEAQRISDIGINLKIILDQFPEKKLIVTGSSSLQIANQTSEPLTGRVWSYQLSPISYFELSKQHSDFDLKNQLYDRLIFGSYPNIFSIENREEKIEYLMNLSKSYLYKDVLEIINIKNSKKIRDLLRLLAFQVGSEVSYSELASHLDLSKDTVAKYIDLLEKSYVIFRLSGFSRNLRKEVTKMDKIYFYDLGIRNSLIEIFKPIKERDDVGKLWENFLIIERIKAKAYQNQFLSYYFWRVYTGAEIDFIEEKEGNLMGYEMKWKNKLVKPPKTWIQNYPNADFKVVNRENYLNFVLDRAQQIS